ncbi:MAG: ComEA family DNA-binding protein [Proteobacteria bacterium]|nr:ComEA family DNA-binding protein [Pseudomonadota bacterium]
MKFSKKISIWLVFSFAFMLIALPVFAAEQAQPQLAAPAKDAKPAKRVPVLEGQININTATADQFKMLPGIGKKIADAIIEFRAKNGNFKTVDDLAKIKGIGEKKLTTIKNYLILEGETTLTKK